MYCYWWFKSTDVHNTPPPNAKGSDCIENTKTMSNNSVLPTLHGSSISCWWYPKYWMVKFKEETCKNTNDETKVRIYIVCVLLVLDGNRQSFLRFSTEHWMFQKQCHVSCRFQFLLDSSFPCHWVKTLGFLSLRLSYEQRSWDTNFFFLFARTKCEKWRKGWMGVSYFNQFVWILSMIKRQETKPPHWK